MNGPFQKLNYFEIVGERVKLKTPVYTNLTQKNQANKTFLQMILSLKLNLGMFIF